MISLTPGRQKALKAIALVEAIFTIAVIGIMSVLALSTISNGPTDELTISAGNASLDEIKRLSYIALI
jgi:Tfp pilus assembly protein FimT